MRRAANGKLDAALGRVEEAIRADLEEANRAARRALLMLILAVIAGAAGIALARASDSPGLAWFAVLGPLPVVLAALAIWLKIKKTEADVNALLPLRTLETWRARGPSG